MDDLYHLGAKELLRLKQRRRLVREEGITAYDAESEPVSRLPMGSFLGEDGLENDEVSENEEGKHAHGGPVRVVESLPPASPRSRQLAVPSSRSIRKHTTTHPSHAYANALPPVVSAPMQAASCPLCKGSGYTRMNVAYGHPQFGKAVPCVCKQAKKSAERLRQLRERSQIDELVAFREATFETFQLWHEGIQEAYDAAWQFAQQPQSWLVLAGENGCGKTHLAVAIARHCLDEGIPTLFAVVPDLLDELRSTFSPKAEECYDEAFLKMREIEVLVMDDLGAESSTSWAQEKLFQLLNHRYNARLATIITTNKVNFEGIENRLRSRLCDRRLVRTVTLIDAQDLRALDAESEVTNIPERENQ